jgi:hypothetical protein
MGKRLAIHIEAWIYQAGNAWGRSSCDQAITFNQ